MEHAELLKKHLILDRLCQLPQRVLSLHGNDNIAEAVLHELCHNCLKLNRAAYLVDNPDFDCMKGIAGYACNEPYLQEVAWETPELFTKHLQQAAFNQRVRSMYYPSMLKAKKNEEETSKIIATSLGLTNPSFCTWQMKHDNHGILVYETKEPIACELVKNGACLLAFCPIY